MQGSWDSRYNVVPPEPGLTLFKIQRPVDGNKSKRIKEEKFNFQRNNYFKKNIFNRIQFFYGKTESEKKN